MSQAAQRPPGGQGSLPSHNSQLDMTSTGGRGQKLQESIRSSSVSRSDLLFKAVLIKQDCCRVSEQKRDEASRRTSRITSIRRFWRTKTLQPLSSLRCPHCLLCFVAFRLELLPFLSPAASLVHAEDRQQELAR